MLGVADTGVPVRAHSKPLQSPRSTNATFPRRCLRLPLSSAQQTPPKDEAQRSTRQRVGRALTSINIPGKKTAQKVRACLRQYQRHVCRTQPHPLQLQLQQRAAGVDSRPVSAAIQRLLKSWQASDEEEEETLASHGSKKQQPTDHQSQPLDQVTSSGEARSNGAAHPIDTEQQPEQESKRSGLLSLFGRGRNGQQPEEALPLRV